MNSVLTSDKVPAPKKKSGWGLGRFSFLAGVLLLGWLAFRLVYIIALGNFHVVVPNLLYRCSQLSGSRLESVVRQNGIKTVVNLRGCCDTFTWYQNQCLTINRCDISQEDLSFSAGRLPSTKTIRLLLDVIENGEKPMIFHCHKGIDRTGMAVVMSLLLLTDAKLDDALRQLGPYYGHLAVGRPAHIDEFFALYRSWLEKNQREHSPPVFRDWVLKDYVPGDCLARLERKEGQGPLQIGVDKPELFRVKATNLSMRKWVFKPGTNAGIKLQWNLSNLAGEVLGGGFSGNFNAILAPGESIDLSMVVPPLAKPGRYLLRLDLNDPQHAAFHQTGSDILEIEVLIS